MGEGDCVLAFELDAGCVERRVGGDRQCAC